MTLPSRAFLDQFPDPFFCRDDLPVPPLVSTTIHPAVVAIHPPRLAMAAAFLEELERQFAYSSAHAHSRRLSRGPSAQRATGFGHHATRVVKSSSANNSPRSSLLQARKRAMVGESKHTRALPGDMSYLPMPAPEAFVVRQPSEYPEVAPTRSLGWHPPVHPFPSFSLSTLPHQAHPAIELPDYNLLDQHPMPTEMPTTPILYSGISSPASATSPVSGLYQFPNRYKARAPTVSSLWASVPVQLPPLEPSPCPSNCFNEPHSANYGPMVLSPAGSAVSEWYSFDAYRFDDKRTAPHSPDDVGMASQPHSKFSALEAIDDESFEDDMDSEILYGMGLYDSPTQKPVMSFSSGHGSPFSDGKGLKLEDAWEPPVYDDEVSHSDGIIDAECEDVV